MIPDWAIRTAADKKAIQQGYTWDHEEAERIVRFAEAYVAPQFITGKFKLLEWEKRFLASLYGWRSPSGGRRWRRATLHVAKKNGGLAPVS